VRGFLQKRLTLLGSPSLNRSDAFANLIPKTGLTFLGSPPLNRSDAFANLIPKTGLTLSWLAVAKPV
jgi:hypothetical protein